MIRFKRSPRYEFNDTSRKRAYVAVRKRKERERLPLFAELIAETQTETVDEEMARRAVQWAMAQQRTRDKKAEDWRNARARLRAMDAEERAATIAHWNRGIYPLGDPGYLTGLIHSVEVGRFCVFDGELVSMHELEWRQNGDDRIRAMSDEDLLREIQTHISDSWRERLRSERQRRATL